MIKVWFLRILRKLLRIKSPSLEGLKYGDRIVKEELPLYLAYFADVSKLIDEVKEEEKE